MIDTLLKVKTENLMWFHNGHWVPMPHRLFFANNLHQHFRNQKRHMPDTQRKVWTEYYRASLVKGVVIHINNLIFKLKDEHDTTHPVCA